MNDHRTVSLLIQAFSHAKCEELWQILVNSRELDRSPAKAKGSTIDSTGTTVRT